MTITSVKFKEATLTTDRAYLVQGLIPRTGISVVWGPPKSGKTFWLFDLMTRVASNHGEYRGRKINGGAVAYFCFEGIKGYEARIEAIRQYGQLGCADPSLYLMQAQLDFAAQYQEVIDAIKENIKPNFSDLQELFARDPNLDREKIIAERQRAAYPAAIVLDTLNRSFAGSESNDKDMAAYIRAADTVSAEFGCAVIIVHHSGHGAQRPRGHSSLTGAVDAQLAVKRKGTADLIVVEVEWMRDGPEGAKIASRLNTVEVGLDSDGDPKTSCVVVPAADFDDVADSREQGSAEKAAERVRFAVEAFNAAARPDGWAEPKVWRDEMRRRGLLGKAKNQRVPYQRVREQISKAGYSFTENGDGFLKLVTSPRLVVSNESVTGA